MATAEEIQAQITELEELLQSGVSSVSTDGTSTTFDLASVRKQVEYLRSQLSDQRKRRPRAARIHLGGF